MEVKISADSLHTFYLSHETHIHCAIQNFTVSFKQNKSSNLCLISKTNYKILFWEVKSLVYIVFKQRRGGRDSSGGIVTRYGLGGPGIESRWGARFSAPVQTGPGAHPASYTMGTGSFPGVKRPWRGVNYPPLSSAEVQGRVELYIYSSSGPSWPVLGWTLPLHLQATPLHRLDSQWSNPERCLVFSGIGICGKQSSNGAGSSSSIEVHHGIKCHLHKGQCCQGLVFIHVPRICMYRQQVEQGRPTLYGTKWYERNLRAFTFTGVNRHDS